MRIPKLDKYLNVLFRDITSFGSFAFHFFLLIFVLAMGDYTLVWKLLFSFFFTLAVTILIRMFYFKDRPSKQNFSNFAERIDAASFPSLHTARTVAMALIVINSVQKNAVTVFLAGFAAIIIYSRVYLQKHDWEDVAGGIILGVVTFFLALLI